MSRICSLACATVLLGACRAYEKDFLYPSGVDADGDGYFGNADTLDADGLEVDCDDEDAEVHPSADEDCDNGKDDDCAYTASCYLWSPTTVDRETARVWQGEQAKGQLGAAIAASDDLRVGVVAAPYQDGYAGAVYLVPWDQEDGAARISASDGALLSSSPDDRLGAALLADVRFTSGGSSYLIVGALTHGEGGAIFAVNSKAPQLNTDAPLLLGDAEAPIGGVLDWSPSLLVTDSTATLILGAPATSRAVLASCSEGIVGSCEVLLTIDGEASSRFGATTTTLTEPEDRLVVGAPDADSVYVFDEHTLEDGVTGDPRSIDVDRAALHLSGTAGSGFGEVIAVADLWPRGDTVGDEYDDLLIAAPDSDVVYLFDGLELNGWVEGGEAELDYSQRALELRGPRGSSFGAAISADSDIDDDGAPDLLIGAPSADGDLGDAPGAVWILQSAAETLYSGATTLDMGELAPTLVGASAGARFGATVTPIQSLNADTYPDILIGAPGQTDGGIDAGAFFVLKGRGE